MHAVVMNRLEEYLAGMLNPADQQEIEAHFSNCEFCREEVQSIQGISQCFTSLRSEEVFDPAPGFVAQVMEQAGRQRPAPTFASLFSFNFAFGRRLALASLLTLAILGSYLVSRESAYTRGPSPEAVMAQQESPAFDSAPAEDNMLVTLTTYDH